MATYEQNGIKFKKVNPAIIPIGAQVGAAKYVIDEDNKITKAIPVINAIDINWNEAQIDSETTIKTTGDLLHYININGGTKGDDGRSAYEVYTDSLKTIINNAIIIDHTNFAEARHNQLEDYYNNFPSEAAGDGETWPPYNPAMFPWLVVNYNFNGEETLHIEYKGEERLVWTPSAEVTCEDGTKVPRTYGIISVSSSEDLGLSEFTETVEGNELLANINDFKVYITTETILTEEE